MVCFSTRNRRLQSNSFWNLFLSNTNGFQRKKAMILFLCVLILEEHSCNTMRHLKRLKSSLSMCKTQFEINCADLQESARIRRLGVNGFHKKMYEKQINRLWFNWSKNGRVRHIGAWPKDPTVWQFGWSKNGRVSYIGIWPKDLKELQ